MDELIQGIPVPYTIRNDDFITGLLYATVLIAIVAFAQSRDFIARELKLFFRDYRDDLLGHNETATEVRFQFFLVFHTCLMLGLAGYLFITHYITDSFTLSSEHTLIFLLFGCFAAYFIGKFLLQHLVGWVSFEPSENSRWQKSQLFLVALEGLPLLPVVLLLCYYSMTFQAALILCILVVIFIKILTFYRCYSVFFKKNRPQVQIFLYFCTLEIIPMVAFYGLMATLIDAIKTD